MNIGIIGAGQLGQALARLLLDADHDVMVANSRGPETLADLVEQLGDGASAGTAAEVAHYGEVVFLATHWDQVPTAVHGIGNWGGTVVVDPTNNYLADGTLLDTGGRGSSELIAAFVPGARLVKAFNHQLIKQLSEHFGAAADPENPMGMFIAGDDPEAKTQVAELIDDIGGEAIDTGDLETGGRLQGAGGPVGGLQPVAAARALLAEHQPGPGSGQ